MCVSCLYRVKNYFCFVLFNLKQIKSPFKCNFDLVVAKLLYDNRYACIHSRRCTWIYWIYFLLNFFLILNAIKLYFFLFIILNCFFVIVIVALTRLLFLIKKQNKKSFSSFFFKSPCFLNETINNIFWFSNICLW